VSVGPCEGLHVLHKRCVAWGDDCEYLLCLVCCTAGAYCVRWHDTSGFVYVRILWGE
jgi:hypothetical protein